MTMMVESAARDSAGSAATALIGEGGHVYRAEVINVFSGDDLILMIDLDVDGLHKRQRVRLLGIDTPNAVNCADDSEAGKVRSFVRALTKGKKATLRVHSRVGNSWVGVVLLDTGPNREPVNLNEVLAAKGYQFSRDGHRDPKKEKAAQ